jgi:hypothetical protein
MLKGALPGGRYWPNRRIAKKAKKAAHPAH